MNEKTLRDLQLCELEILKEFIKVCDANNLKYYIAVGTLLGAVRHKGFIPWDEDIDVYMVREDYEKFVKIASDILPTHLKLHYFKNEDNDKKDITYQSTIMNTKYKLKLNHTKNGVIRNPWLDIWPIDTMPANKLAFFIRKYRILYKRFRYQASVFDNWADVSERRKRPIFEKILIFLVDKLGLGKKSNPKKMLDRLDKELKKNVKKPKYYMNGMSKYKFKNLMPIEVYGEGKEYEFEGLTLRGPVDYDYYLTRIYGDYMTPPPDSEKDRYSIEIIEDNTNE